MKHVITYLIGLIFGIGITISGMGNPAKVLNFFDFAGTWDPSLAFVMAGGLIVTAIGYRIVFGKPAPVYDAQFITPARNRVDAKLLGGSALFGLGWGITGFCPGGALPVLGTGRAEVFLFVAALIGGILITKAGLRLRDTSMPPAEPL
ncbi:MAG: YeeE/YedE family protein [Marinosulfonomonas sp.]|nr:YeeE/YedE family protein [Marinosulfonomonas sp.]